MEHRLQDSIGFDQLAWILATLILLSYLLPSILNPDQCWLIHPIILAHQATFSPTRKQSETPTITNSGASPHSLSVTPDRSVKSLYDLLLKAQGKLQQIGLHSIVPQNVSLKTLISNARNHLWSKTKTGNDPDHPQVLILCVDPYLKLVLSLAAATLPMVTMVGAPKLSGTMSVEAKRALEPCLDHLSLVISDLSTDVVQELLGPKLRANCEILSVSDTSGWFQPNETEKAAPVNLSELSKARLRIVHHSTKPEKEPQIFEFTPQNLLAGITGSLGLFPLAGKLTAKDTIALEFGEDENIWGCESSIAVAGLYAGADVYFVNGFKHLSECKPTVLAIKAMTAQILAEEIVQLSKLSFLKKLAIGRRLYQVSSGMLGSPLPETNQWVGPKLRAILTNDPISQSSATLIRAGFGASLQRLYVHPVAAGPVLAGQQYDFQFVQPHRPATQAMIPCGPPAVNVECKIVDVPEPALVNHDAWKGKLLVRGPSIGTESASAQQSSGSANQPFYAVAEVAQVLPNGTFLVFSPAVTGDD
ncbi:hypothetical protein PTTG_01042 [Puccinia triticina 1-1 BBBD Race 1]|uniref:AMP-dependent synthetase/ligase domain-containing protein n=1 Tax=Puccinia triticina (isolate 1-1 / race 1 (BBBD)) TaxID=630390 RepID=A0A180GQX0_PUCT1|nr:hypothetical protein PTTG_01042 [Puccinia triticina 1-1 BBBD Race 1]